MKTAPGCCCPPISSCVSSVHCDFPSLDFLRITCTLDGAYPSKYLQLGKAGKMEICWPSHKLTAIPNPEQCPQKKKKKKKNRERKNVGYVGRGFFVEFGTSRVSSLSFCKLFHCPSNIIRSRNLYTHRSPMILHTRASGATIPVE